MARYQTDMADLPRLDGAVVHILSSRIHWDAAVRNLTEACAAALERLGAKTVTHILPGSLELPLAAQVVADRYHPDAIVCLGVLVKGETFHFEMVYEEVGRGLGEVSRRFGIPILSEVLPVLRLEDAVARSAPDGFNKGLEAASAAAQMIGWLRGLPA
ncbi:6,7-dimethyl-8-ribityllumazine synthase [Sphingomonas sp. MMS24-J13]|uniref:6,7-dimethyl-8-ribityllumazine synthase n=1 Tax=Sphingomonas sp. MMS24-J13 TaxID=3238686 RepID=UPI00384E77A5